MDRGKHSTKRLQNSRIHQHREFQLKIRSQNLITRSPGVVGLWVPPRVRVLGAVLRAVATVAPHATEERASLQWHRCHDLLRCVHAVVLRHDLRHTPEDGVSCTAY
jgi:hypothetical protein